VLVVDEDGLKYLESIKCMFNCIVVNTNKNAVEKSAIMTLVLSRIDKVDVNTLIAGLDYGSNIGLAIFADSNLIFVNSYRGEESVIKTLKMFFDAIPASKKVIRIGIPSELIHAKLSKFIDDLLKKFSGNVVIELVHEHKTSKSSLIIDESLDEDSIAAINIALKAFQNY